MPIQVSFSHPEETDLVFLYVHKQMAAFARDGVNPPTYEVLVGEKEIIVELTSPDEAASAQQGDGEESA